MKELLEHEKYIGRRENRSWWKTAVVRDSRFIVKYIAIIYINTVDAVTINSSAHRQ